MTILLSLDLYTNTKPSLHWPLYI